MKGIQSLVTACIVTALFIVFILSSPQTRVPTMAKIFGGNPHNHTNMTTTNIVLPICSDDWKEKSTYKYSLKSFDFMELNSIHQNMTMGGFWHPSDCEPIDKVAIVVPFRDRNEHLRILLHNLHNYLQDQKLQYRIFIVEQVANQTFNRGKLMNVGYIEAIQEVDTEPDKVKHSLPWSCFIFHDVDLIPEGIGPSYACEDEPKLVAYYQSQFDYKLPYTGYLGGVVSLNHTQYLACNGFSNDYWGWGGEDDDIAYRVRANGWKNLEPSKPYGRFHMNKHEKYKGQPVNPCRFKLLDREPSRWKREGLNSLSYVLIKRQSYQLYTHLLVDLQEEASRNSVKVEGICQE